MWLYCLCGVGNFGPFGGMASGLLAFHTHFYFIFLASPIRNMCVLGLQLSALVMHSVVQLCCYFVVSSFAHLFYTHLQSRQVDLTLARETLKLRCEDLKNTRQISMGGGVDAQVYLQLGGV